MSDARYAVTVFFRTSVRDFIGTSRTYKITARSEAHATAIAQRYAADDMPDAPVVKVVRVELIGAPGATDAGSPRA